MELFLRLLALADGVSSPVLCICLFAPSASKKEGRETKAKPTFADVAKVNRRWVEKAYIRTVQCRPKHCEFRWRHCSRFITSVTKKRGDSPEETFPVHQCKVRYHNSCFFAPRSPTHENIVEILQETGRTTTHPPTHTPPLSRLNGVQQHTFFANQPQRTPATGTKLSTPAHAPCPRYEQPGQHTNHDFDSPLNPPRPTSKLYCGCLLRSCPIPSSLSSSSISNRLTTGSCPL